MNLVEEIEKLRDGGYVGVDKHMVKVCEAIFFYAENFNMKKNYARLQYDQEFDLNCRQAEEAKQDLWVYLSNKFKIPEEERYLINAPDKLKNKKKRQDCIKWRFWPFFYEWRINNFANPIIYAFSKGILSYRKRGKKGGKQGTLKKINRQEIIVQAEKKLNNDGIKKPTNLRIAQEIEGENEGYVQKFRAKRKKEKSRC